MENISPVKLQSNPTMPLYPVSPERMNASKQQVPQSPSLPAFASYPTGSPHSSPTYRRKESDVQGMVARFNALGIEDHQELRRRDEAALKRAQLGREQAEEDCQRLREETRGLRRGLEEGRERERRVAKRIESVMEQLHSEKEKTISMQKTYEREIRRARKEAFKSSSALLETQKELKVTRAALNAAKVNLEKWVIPDGEELKVRAEGVEMELSKALRLVEHMKMECQFGVCSCRLAEMKGQVYVADAEGEVLELMHSLRPNAADVAMDEQPPAYEEPQRQDSAMEDTPTPAPQASDEKHEARMATPRRSSTVGPPGDMMIFSPNTGTFHRVPDTTSDLTPRGDHGEKGDDEAFSTSDPNARDASTSTHDFAHDDEPKTPTTPATSVQAFSPDHGFLATSEDEQDDVEQEQTQLHTKPVLVERKASMQEEAREETPHMVEDVDETLDEDEEPLESPTTHIRATTQITTVPLAPLSSPSKPRYDDQEQDLEASQEPIRQPTFGRSTDTEHHQSFYTAAERCSRAVTPLAETSETESRSQHHAPITPKLDMNIPIDFITPAPKSAGATDNILSATPWENYSSTPLTRDEAIAMLRARRGRAKTNAAEGTAPGNGGASNTPKRSASHGQGLGRKNGAVTPGRRDISTVSAPDLGGRTPGGRKR